MRILLGVVNRLLDILELYALNGGPDHMIVRDRYVDIVKKQLKREGKTFE
ncbi:MAG: hypothetical protein GTO63_12220 [Anaerolineae bacterium]|nr:hypothetical protein [Anaerolineae bacterium]NIN95662.1 hypothetical protein [Anaerolineae bacterium]NIQ78617.1 hypothetical protein [Anaerolineae bacterium]